MTQNYDNVYGGINAYDKNIMQTGNVMHAKDKGVQKSDDGKFDVSDVNGYRYSKSTSEKKDSVIDGFEEYMKTKQAKAKEEGLDESAKQKEEKEAEKEIAAKLSDEEIRKLKLMGIDIENAKLDDIIGMVNTMRGEAHREKMAQMMAEISMSSGDADGMIVSGGTVVAAGSGIELSNIDVADVALAEEESFVVEEGDLVNLIKNDSELVNENLYKAHFSGTEAVEEIDDSLVNNLKDQINKVIDQAGLPRNDEVIKGAKFLLANELPVSTDNLRRYMQLKDLVGKNINEISLEDYQVNYEEKANKLYEMVSDIKPENVYDMEINGREVTIAAASLYENANNQIEVFDDLNAVSSMRRMQEIRLSMTLEASFTLVKNDINIDTRDLSQVVYKLRQLEQKLIAQSLINNDVEPTKENIELVKEISTKINDIADAPAQILASPLKNNSFTINSLAISVTEENVSIDSRSLSFEKVRRSYEAVGTEVRTDLGDSIKKAFSNVKELLTELNIAVNSETERAARILGYNQLEINQYNIDSIVEYDRQVNDLIKGFYPEAVMGLIKDGINPLDMSIDDLNRVIREKNYNAGVTEAENFATYLRDMEKLGDITAEERESYIGIYRAMDKLAKSGDREAGYIFANGARLTVRNLIGAMRSRRAAGIDTLIDDDFGMLDNLEQKTKRIDAQIESAFNRELYMEGIDAINDEEVSNFLKSEEIAFTMINSKAAYTMLNTPGGIYELAGQVLGKLKFKTLFAEETEDEEAENITDSLSGEEIPVDFGMESILESLSKGGNLSLKYEDMRERIVEFMYEKGMEIGFTSKDIAPYKTISAGFNILRDMAGKDRYQIPYKTSEGMGVMNLTIRHDSENRGSIEINCESRQFGYVNASLRLESNDSISGNITSQSSEGNVALMEKQGSLKELFDTFNLNSDMVSFGQIAANTVSQSVSVVAGSRLYQVAANIVRVMANF